MNLAKKLWMTTGDSSGGQAPSGGYVDDVFSTYLYTGNGSAQTINNGIDLAGKGGLVWIKGRSGTTDHALYDTARGATLDLVSNSTAGQITQSTGLTTFGNSGFSVGSLAKLNTNSSTYASWTFRRAPKFFDVVTYTGNGVAGRQIAHSLGVAPGMVIVKAVNGAAVNWQVYHRGFTYTQRLALNTTDAASASAGIWSAEPDATNIFVGSATGVNANAVNYVAYLFAHDPSADGIIQCGSFTTDGSGNATVNLGWEPQFLLFKASSVIHRWEIQDSMRGMAVTDGASNSNPFLRAEMSNAEANDGYAINTIKPQATGFTYTRNDTSLANTTFIYLAIRRPNKPPTSGAQVYNAIARTGTGAAATVTGVGFALDLQFNMARQAPYDQSFTWYDRLRGALNKLNSSNVTAEVALTDTLLGFDVMDGIRLGVDLASGDRTINYSALAYINYFFRRAPGFFDVVCDTGTGAAHAIVHNLTKAPELIIRKSRSAATQWEVWHSALAATEKLVLNSNAAKATDTAAWNSTLATATQFTVGTGANVNANTTTFVTYLFATLTGISKVGSYSGNGGTQTIPCGFTTGSRFILIKRIDNTGDWFVWDTARGITPTTDPHLSLNTAAAEVTTDDSIDQDASGFIVNQNAATNINALGGNYLFLAIA